MSKGDEKEETLFNASPCRKYAPCAYEWVGGRGPDKVGKLLPASYHTSITICLKNKKEQSIADHTF